MDTFRAKITVVPLAGKSMREKYLECSTCVYQHYLSKLQGDDDIIELELYLHLVWNSDSLDL